MDIESRFSGKTVVITGAGGNFGKEGCIYFLRRGARVAALDKSTAALQEVTQEVQELQSTCSEKTYEFCTFECDVTNAQQVQDVVDRIVEQFEGIDMLWNNAGYQGQIKPTLEYDPVDFGLVMNINVTGMFIMLQAVARKMAAAGKGGTIVNTASVAGLRGTPAMVAYSSSKAAVLAMTVTTAKDLAPHGIRVNAVSPALIGPGYMWTRQNELHAASGSPYFAKNPDQVAKSKVDSVPMKRLGTVEEVIKAVAFLLSDESSYSTATNLVVDGGLSGGLKA
jgi:NAD(P)-dependent dehydrogenase (short-subunit alcohol dehydrogenase family)